MRGSPKCAREDSNLHGPYSPQAPQPWTARVDASASVWIVQIAGFPWAEWRHWTGWMLPRVLPRRSPKARVRSGSDIRRDHRRDPRTHLARGSAGFAGDPLWLEGPGGSHNGSDFDMLVIEPEVEDSAGEAVRLRRELRDAVAPIDVVVVDREGACRRAAVRGTMVERALREGRILADTLRRSRQRTCSSGRRRRISRPLGCSPATTTKKTMSSGSTHNWWWRGR